MQYRLRLTENDILNNFNSSLERLKEEFHRTGRFDDANAKLDEVLKLLTIKFYDLKYRTNYLNIEHLNSIASREFKDASSLAKALQYVFKKIAKENIFFNKDGTNIFGSNPDLNIQPVDNEFAKEIIETVNDINLSQGLDRLADFDLLNEAFGHFVRVNFRNHKEDAQYMTPVEVVNAMVEIALTDILNDTTAKNNLLSKSRDSFYILDPTCGVGSFLAKASQKVSEVIKKYNLKDYSKILEIRKKYSFIGQDKVDRMIRMSKINYLFNGLNPSMITQGNSIIGESYIDSFKGKIDLIITNPPFGAEFNFYNLLKDDKKYEIFHIIKNKVKISTISSELIILDRSLKLLKPGGRLLIIVPDSVVSSSGVYDIYREYLSKYYLLKGVIDLPAVTFAQAGTRTKCSILYIQKPYDTCDVKQNGIFMSVVNSIGYEVKEKMGTPTKIHNGHNELLDVISCYKSKLDYSKISILNEKPSIVIYQYESLINNKWNANFYKADRINAVNRFDNINYKYFEIKKIEDIAEFCTTNRKKRNVDEDIKCISVLHINEDSSIIIADVLAYKPNCPGYECYPGEILFSKINPRIPRIAVVPEIGFKLVCSSEFEILKTYENKYIYLLKSILLTDIVQKQINALTSGTSSSHNRIKSSELMKIIIPWPKKGTKIEEEMLNNSKKIEIEENNKYKLNIKIKEAFSKVEELIGV